MSSDIIPISNRNYKWVLSKPNRRYDARHNLEGFDEVNDKRQELGIRVKGLRSSGLVRDAKVADCLTSCRPRNRCWCAACPLCMRKLRIWLVSVALRAFPDTEEVLYVTLIPDVGVIKSLKELDLLDLVANMRKRFVRCGLVDSFAIGGFEVDRDKEQNRWVPHFHLVVKSADMAGLKLLRERYYYPTEHVSRPMMIQRVKNPIRQFSYCLKSFAALKERYFDVAHGKERTRKKRLCTDHQNEALRFFAQYNPQNLIFMRGIRRYGEKVYFYEKGVWNPAF